MDINEFVNIFSRAWSLEILAMLNRGIIGRQSDLIRATGAGRTAFGNSLQHLISLRLIERNPGHGHPLRPEFRLSEKGKIYAQIANRILGEASPNEFPILRRTWTIPILAITAEPKPFGIIRSELKTITDRALSQALKNLEETNWIQRSVDLKVRPPRPFYNAYGIGKRISASVYPI